MRLLEIGISVLGLTLLAVLVTGPAMWSDQMELPTTRLWRWFTRRKLPPR